MITLMDKFFPPIKILILDSVDEEDDVVEIGSPIKRDWRYLEKTRVLCIRWKISEMWWES